MARSTQEDRDFDQPRPKRKGLKGDKDLYGFRVQLKGQQKQERSECSTSAQAMQPDWAFVPQVRACEHGSGSVVWPHGAFMCLMFKHRLNSFIDSYDT